MAIPFFMGDLNPIEILGQDNVGDQNLVICKVVLKYAEHSISFNFPISFGFPITFKLEYNGGIIYMCNRFQTHKRFKRFEVYKSDVLVLLF